MTSAIAAFALQQLQDMEQLQRDLGRRRRGAALSAKAAPAPARLRGSTGGLPAPRLPST
jgi:hypothetical protein